MSFKIYGMDAEESEEFKTNLQCTRFEDGSLRLRNSKIQRSISDTLYHLNLDSRSNDFPAMFGDVKFVCMTGTRKRAELFAELIRKKLCDNSKHKENKDRFTQDFTSSGDRFSLYKVGPILSVSHGMGMASISILLNEVIKLLYHARVKDPIFFRLGTSGGIGLEPGTVVISENILNDLFTTSYDVPVLGKIIKRPASIRRNLVNELKGFADTSGSYQTLSGTTLCTSDFYEGQARMDGAFCEFSESEQRIYFDQLKSMGVVNIEMESLAFAAMTHHAGIRSAVVCVTVVNRLKDDQIVHSKEVITDWENRTLQLVFRFIEFHTKNDERNN